MKQQSITCLLIVLALMLANPIDASAQPSAANHEADDHAAISIETSDAMQSTEQYNSFARTRKKQRKQAVMSWVTLEKRYPGAFVTHGPRNVRRAALTFDDVPDPRYTGKVLDVLARYNVKATFFVLGSLAARYPALVRRMEREGHTVGNHSYNHAVFSQLTAEQYNRQIARTDAILAPLVGYSPRYIRPPYGEIRSAQVQWAKRNGYVIVNWDVDSVDWRSLRSRAVIINVRKTLQPGSIILQHAGGGATQDLSGTVEALPVIIRMLKNKGYELVTIPEMLGSSDGRRQ
ncbi:peptidoglycan/xylan/chitin deacetylase (PgdA/CDA1 family) [Paenibacillus cellulosilyticus]|uniref:Peptidoglycan/xylan/chitin deacetylase (PgdA/CDA1 family) n=1 Tax=Paenibacillus cellulosilyticus TaxID=375489 RepID=A0A2V2Z832_9BACL|nr:polysaccharide deacetylase family protein [Paenibacillus cellulosilyticus]PWW07516.1 peptidoglycan/xylan/chitin deacetylase (PgdA/CDA1 family) [Paenibacillus cellulosilyticus]QKS44330.1 polysaccharide deacetylase family protein [Paenibacillus cellulosilyticus]